MATYCYCDCLKATFIIFNSIFFLGGLFSLLVGLWLTVVNPDVDHFLNIISETGLRDPFWDVTAWMCVGLGGFLILVSFFGYIAACTDNTGLLITYCVFIGLAMGGQLAASIMATIFRLKITNDLREAMPRSLNDSYINETSHDSVSKAWNRIQVKWQCCGTRGYGDFIDRDYNNNDPNRPVPYTCCFIDKKDRDDDIPIPDPEVEQRCMAAARNRTTDSQDLYTDGCFETMNKWSVNWSTVLFSIGYILTFLEIFGLVVAVQVKKGVVSRMVEDDEDMPLQDH